MVCHYMDNNVDNFPQYLQFAFGKAIVSSAASQWWCTFVPSEVITDAAESRSICVLLIFSVN